MLTGKNWEQQQQQQQQQKKGNGNWLIKKTQLQFSLLIWMRRFSFSIPS
jgi:hypothetical protein